MNANRRSLLKGIAGALAGLVGIKRAPESVTPGVLLCRPCDADDARAVLDAHANGLSHTSWYFYDEVDVADCEPYRPLTDADRRWFREVVCRNPEEDHKALMAVAERAGREAAQRMNEAMTAALEKSLAG